MKNEKERMNEYLKDHVNAHSDLLKVDEVDKIVHRVNIGVKTFIIIIIIVLAIMLFFIGVFIYPKISLIFGTNRKDFIKDIENTYNQKVEIIQTNSTRKGNGNYLLKTKKEPKIEFHAAKNVYDSTKIDYEDCAFIYYIENYQEAIFNNIKYEKKTDTFNGNEDFEFIKCEPYLLLNSYKEIEQGSRQLIELQKWMTKRIKKFSIPIHLKIGDYISRITYENIQSEENVILQEKYQYYLYLKNNKKDISIIPEKDLLQITEQ